MGDPGSTLQVARLAGVIETPGEHTNCSLVFVLKTEEGHTIHLTYGGLMEALRFAQQQAVMPALSEDWWARTGRYDGCSFQDQAGTGTGL